MRPIVFAFVFLLTALSAPAQIRNFSFPWWDSPIAKNLDLSEDQRRQIRSTVYEYRTRLIDMRAAVEKAEAEIEQIFNDEQVDTPRAADTIERLVAARADLTRAVSLMGLKLRTILTAQQWQELQRRRREGRPEFRRRQGPAPRKDSSRKERRP